MDGITMHNTVSKNHNSREIVTAFINKKSVSATRPHYQTSFKKGFLIEAIFHSQRPYRSNLRIRKAAKICSAP